MNSTLLPKTLQDHCSKVVQDGLYEHPASRRHYHVFYELMKHIPIINDNTYVIGPYFHVKKLFIEQERDKMREFLRKQEERISKWKKNGSKLSLTTWNLPLPDEGAPVHGYLVALEEGSELRVSTHDKKWIIAPQNTNTPLRLYGTTFFMFEHALPTLEAPFFPNAHVIVPRDKNVNVVNYLVIIPSSEGNYGPLISPPFFYHDGLVGLEPSA